VWEGPELYIRRRCSRIWFDEKWRRYSIPFSRVLQSFCTSGYVIWTWWTAEWEYGIDVLSGRGSSRVRPGQLPSLSRVRRILTWSSTSAWEEGHVYVGLLGLFEVIYEDLASLRWDACYIADNEHDKHLSIAWYHHPVYAQFSTALE